MKEFALELWLMFKILIKLIKLLLWQEFGLEKPNGWMRMTSPDKRKGDGLRLPTFFKIQMNQTIIPSSQMLKRIIRIFTYI